MNNINPCYIPRNHIVEEVLMSAMNNDLSELNKFIKILENPFKEITEYEEYASPQLNSDSNYVTYCGT